MDEYTLRCQILGKAELLHNTQTKEKLDTWYVIAIVSNDISRLKRLNQHKVLLCNSKYMRSILNWNRIKEKGYWIF